MAEETTVRSVRASREVFDRLTELTKESFGNTNSALEALLNAWDIQSAKETMGEAKTAIADFDMHVQAIQRGYLHALDLVKGAEARALDTVRTQLEAKEETIVTQRQKLEDAERRAQEAETAKAKAEEEAERHAQETQAARRRAEAAENTLARTEATAAQTATDKQGLIDSLTRQVAEERAKAEENAAALKELPRLREEIRKAKQELKDAQTAAIVADAKATAAQAEAVAAIQKETSFQLLKLTGERGELQAEVERLKAQITTLETALALERERKATNATPMNDQQTPPNPAEDTSNAAKRPKTTPKREQKKPAPKQKATEKGEIPGLAEAQSLINAWNKYQAAFQASFEGENAVGGMTDAQKPQTTVEDYLKDHPAAAAYLRAETESLKTNYELAAIGKKALDAIKANPDEYAAAIKQMEADLHAYSDAHMWD